MFGRLHLLASSASCVFPLCLLRLSSLPPASFLSVSCVFPLCLLCLSSLPPASFLSASCVFPLWLWRPMALEADGTGGRWHCLIDRKFGSGPQASHNLSSSFWCTCIFVWCFAGARRSILRVPAAHSERPDGHAGGGEESASVYLPSGLRQAGGPSGHPGQGARQTLPRLLQGG